MLGMIADGTGYILLAFATRGWMAFPIMVLLASGGIGMPALQTMLSRQVDEERQGQLQGSLAALTSLTSIVGPLLFTAIYAASITTWNGWAWIAGAALYLLCLPALRRGLGAAQGNEPIADRGNDRPCHAWSFWNGVQLKYASTGRQAPHLCCVRLGSFFAFSDDLRSASQAST